MTLRPLRALRRINASISELEMADLRAREEARVELARSATAYSQKAREVVDDTMSLSAVLMRAGEVGEAERLLAVTERDVRQEKEVLLESVQEAKVATRDRRVKMTRLRLAKMVATAFVGGSVFLFSAMGVALAKYFRDALPVTSDSGAATLQNVEDRSDGSSTLRISLDLGNMKLELSPGQYDRFRKLISESDPERLRSFLLRIVPSGLAGQLDQALAQAGITKPVQLAELEETTGDGVQEIRKRTPTGSTASSSGGTGDSQEKRKARNKGGGGSGEDDPTSGSSGCEDENDRDGDEQNGLGDGPLPGCLPFIDDEDDSKD